MTLREELIQVAAVAVAIVEDLDYGAADSGRVLSHPNDRAQSKKTITSPVLAQVFEERQRQDRKWGRQHHTPAEWMAILMEEVGEAAGECTDPTRLADLIDQIRYTGEDAEWLLRHVLFPAEEAAAAEVRP